ncbi:hypothetical protein [Nonomuraea rubra]|uniref:hypothetical protein n=1 Tax=Nonomuraea rubra TaxID=46180 RepID=UPI0033DF4509
MAGKCGQTFRIEPRIAGSTCQAIQETAAGLLVPAVEVDGIAAGAPVGTERSVEIDVAAPAATDCPQVWTIGGRLSAPTGSATGAVDLQPTASGTWTPVTGAQIVLPEAGRYLIEADARARISAFGPANVFISTRLFNVTAGTVIPASATLVFQTITDAGQNATGNQTATTGVFLTVAGPTTVRLEAMRVNSVGTSTAADILNDAAGATRIRFVKVAD